MDFRTNLLRMLLVDFVLAIFIVFFLQPTRSVPFPEFFAIILAGEVVASILAYLFSRSTLAYVLVQTLVLSAFLAFVFVIWLKPAASIGYDSAFLYVFVIQTMGLTASYLIVRRTRKKN